jgi:hypothetical protein
MATMLLKEKKTSKRMDNKGRLVKNQQQNDNVQYF